MTKAKKTDIERRKYPRLMAPVYYHVPKTRQSKRQVSNISLGGARIYSDEYLDVGKQLEIQLYLPDRDSVKALVKVVWIKQLPSGSESIYDVGLEFIDLTKNAIETIRAVLEASQK